MPSRPPWPALLVASSLVSCAPGLEALRERLTIVWSTREAEPPVDEGEPRPPRPTPWRPWWQPRVPYPLDDLSRAVAPTGRAVCPDVPLYRYDGEVLKYGPPVVVNPHFRERLRRFEQVARQAAIDVYGRPPRRIRHMGAYLCRRIRARGTRLSEHGLGNALDLAGFDFGPAKRRGPLPDGLPLALRKPFRVTILKHWQGTGAIDGHHQRFLRLLTDRLGERQDIFRIRLGPSWPGHRDHLHLDCGRWNVVRW